MRVRRDLSSRQGPTGANLRPNIVPTDVPLRVRAMLLSMKAASLNPIA